MVYTILEFLAFVITYVIEELGYAGVFLLMAIESSGIPAPSEIIMPFSGFLVSGGVFNFWILVFWGVVGNVAGSLLFYWIGFRFGNPFIERFGKYFLISIRDAQLAERWFEKWGGWTVFVGRILPAVRTYISFPAGVARMNIWKFVIYSTAGIIPWVIFLAWIGVFLGKEWSSLEHYFRKFDILILTVILFGVFWWIRRHFKHLAIGKKEIL